MEIKKYLNNLFKRSLLSLIILIIVSFALKHGYFYDELYNLIYKNNIDFAYIKSKTNFLFGSITGSNRQFVSSNKLKYSYIEPYENSFIIHTDYHYVVNNIHPGIVIYVGDKESLGSTIIVEGDNQVNYWYSNLENISVNLYDRIDTKAIIGSTIEDNFILTLTKDDTYLSYEEYI